ncbi:sulfatase-like hydrolase/transferase [Janthinobacterium sp. 17J80-10]|uniref:sulfatase-like hydrolase/transferase n=1 Tax=Janthinobacterium sp. 17J80-10 TaxID=2497863 RepID=UPI0013E8B4ED|nr:sulfatase-like hydrolase/transferase [Janthinobacterium sp. 17J80-10]
MRTIQNHFFTITALAASLLIAIAFFLQGFLSYLYRLNHGEEIIHVINKVDQVGFLLLLGLVLLMVVSALGFHRLERSKSLLTFFLLAFILTVVAKGKFDNMGSDSMAEIMHANSQEGGDFIESYLSFVKLSVKECIVLFGPLLLIPVYALLVRKSGGTAGLRDIRLALKIIALVYLLTIAHFFYQMAVNYHSIDYFRERLESSTARAVGALGRTREAPNVVVYIGESTSRENFPLYMPAYAQADPLQEIRDELIVFSDVVTSFSHTFPSLYRAFTMSKDPYLDQFLLIKDLRRPNTLAVLEKGGMETHWISNQNLVGRWDWNSELFGRHSQHLKVLNGAERMYFNGVRKTDRALVAAYLEEASHLERSRQMMFLHSYAGHADYCKNIPREEHTVSGRFLPTLSQHALFGDMYVGDLNERMESIDCYGSVMSFVSKNLRAVIDDIAQRTLPVVFLYFADHGEEIYEGTGHDSRRNSYRHIEIPFFIYFNSAAREAYPDLYRAAQENRTKPYSIEWLSDTLIDLAGIDYKERQLLSVFRPDMQAPKRYALRRTDIRGNQFILAVDDEDASQRHDLLNHGHDYFRKRRLYNAFPGPEKNKLCSSRTNSLLKFREAASIFQCVEIDITIDAEADKLYVYRPPQANNHLQLKDLIAFGPPLEGHMLLAIRNPDSRNLAVLQAQLDRLFLPDQRHRIVIEIPHFDGVDRQGLQRLAKAGYELFYALPADLGAGCARDTLQAVCQRFAREILPVIEQAGVQGIAFDIEAVPFVRSLHAATRLQYSIKDMSAGGGKDIDRAILARSNTYSIPYRSAFDY